MCFLCKQELNFESREVQLPQRCLRLICSDIRMLLNKEDVLRLLQICNVSKFQRILFQFITSAVDV